MISRAIAGAVAGTVNGDFATTIDVFGAWAIASGATLVQYSTGGALWYAVAATWLLASPHRHRGQALDISSLPSAVDRGEADASNLAPAERP